MNGKIFIVGSVLTVFFLTFSSQASAQALYSRDLSLGMTGPDVKALQIKLNQDPATAVVAIGPGSPGNETSYFGPKTAAAVVNFQEKYAADILAPAGLSSGTGYVGTRTRAKLEELAATDNLLPKVISKDDSEASASSSIETAVPLTTDPFSTSTGSTNSSSRNVLLMRSDNGVIDQKHAFQAVSPNDLLIFGLSHNEIKPGDSLIVAGFGFNSATVLNIGQSYSVSTNATSSDSFTVRIPAIPYGTYDLWVSDSQRTSAGKSPFKLIIADATDKRPNILSVSPRNAGTSGSVTVIADSLDASGNTIYSNLGIIKSVPSTDGHSMTFKASDLPNSFSFSNNESIDRFIVTFGVGTSRGSSLNYGYFILTK